MATTDVALLGLLQLADGGFPSGAYVLSHGLETLIADGAVHDGAGLAAALRVSLLGRHARADLPVLLAAHDIGTGWPGHAVAPGTESRAATVDAPDLEALIELDRRLTAVKLAREEREGSARVGRRLAVEAGRLVGSAALAAFAEAIEAGRTPGNAAVAQGLAMAGMGSAGEKRGWPRHRASPSAS